MSRASRRQDARHFPVPLVFPLGGRRTWSLPRTTSAKVLRRSFLSRIAQPRFKAKTKHKLGNSEVAGLVNTAFGNKLENSSTKSGDRRLSSTRSNAAVAREGRTVRATSHAARTFSKGRTPGKTRRLRFPRSGRMRIPSSWKVTLRRLCEDGPSARGSGDPPPARSEILNVGGARFDRVLGADTIQDLDQCARLRHLARIQTGKKLPLSQNHHHDRC